jgi:radical SAM superfamily enzyme YgiQ (UPF0313 family)
MNIKKVLFVNLSNARIYDTPEKRPILEPMWAEYIDAAVKDYHKTYILDMNSNPALEPTLEEFLPDFVFVSITTPLVKEAKEVISVVRRKMPNVKVVIGGPHVSALSGEGIDFDIAVKGEGEITSKKILDGLISSGVVIGEVPEINQLPFPTRIERKGYFLDYADSLDHSQVLASVMTSRSCPWGCTYCASKIVFGRKLRSRTSQSVLDELTSLKEKYGVNRVIFLDDCFTVDKKRVEEICKGMIERKLNIKWWIDTRCDRVDEKTLTLMKQAGCDFIVFGVESGDQNVLNRIKKNVTLDTMREAFRLAKKVGIKTKCNIMIGHLDETREEIMRSIFFAKELDATKSSFYKVIPLPGSELYDVALQRGLISKETSFDAFGWYKSPPVISKVSQEELDQLQKLAYSMMKK